MAKKVFIVSVIIFVLAGVILAFLKINSSKTIEINNQEDLKTENVDKKAENLANPDQKIMKLIEGDIQGIFLNKGEEKLVYCNGSNILESDLNGKMKRSLAAYPFNEIQKIIWSGDGKKAIIKDNNDFLLIFLEENRTEKLKDGVDEAIFDFSGNYLIYKYYQFSEQKRSLNISDLSGNNWQELTEVGFREVVLASHPFNDSFLFYPKARALEESVLSIFDVKKKEKREIFKGKYGADYLWSPDGSKILVSFAPENNKSKLFLGVMNSDGGEFLGLNFPTSTKKCVWSGDNQNIYCAMLNNFPKLSILPDDWDDEKYYSADTFWKIDTATGQKERIIDLAELQEEIDAVNLVLDNEERYLFMINKKNKDLYRINL
jgi:hypothetical protein